MPDCQILDELNIILRTASVGVRQYLQDGFAIQPWGEMYKHVSSDDHFAYINEQNLNICSRFVVRIYVTLARSLIDRSWMIHDVIHVDRGQIRLKEPNMFSSDLMKPSYSPFKTRLLFRAKH